jgi:sugar (pentulose or hexulose) kinase
VKTTEVIVTGGGARSPFWCQMFADCTGRRMLIPEGTEFGGKGAAILAGIGIGIYKNFEDARSRTFRLARSHEPNPEVTRQYEKVFQLYREIYQSSQEHWWRRLRMLDELS